MIENKFPGKDVTQEDLENKFPLAARKSGQPAPTFRVAGVEFGGPLIPVMAGPNMVESEAMIVETARAVKARGAHFLRGGAFKPLSFPYRSDKYNETREDGIRWLATAKEETGIGIITEVMEERFIDMVVEVAGVYGRQEPLSFSSPVDKRDLLIVFGLDRKIQYRDSFFHNANSAFRRETWDRIPFDEEVPNIEDRVWGKAVIADGMQIVYEPEASVYHYHGIHQELNTDRASSISRIMEAIDGPASSGDKATGELSVSAVIPVMGPPRRYNGYSLIEHSLKHALESRLVNRVIVATDNVETAEISKSAGAIVPGLRPKALSEPFIGIGAVLQWALDQIENAFGVQDLIAILEETHPFRPAGLLDALIKKCVSEGLDSVIAARPEGRRLWLQDNDGYSTAVGDASFAPRAFKESPAMLGLFGLGCVSHSVFLRTGEPLGDKIGLYEVLDTFAAVEIRTNDDLSRSMPLLHSSYGILK